MTPTRQAQEEIESPSTTIGMMVWGSFNFA